MFARFDENPAMPLQDTKETKRYGRTDGQRENSIPTTNKVCGGYNYTSVFLIQFPNMSPRVGKKSRVITMDCVFTRAVTNERAFSQFSIGRGGVWGQWLQMTGALFVSLTCSYYTTEHYH